MDESSRSSGEIMDWIDVREHIPPYGKLVLIKGKFDNEPIMLARRRELCSEKHETATKIKIQYYDVFTEAIQSSDGYGYGYRLNGDSNNKTEKKVTHWLDLRSLACPT
jgi:hypothetical protein